MLVLSLTLALAAWAASPPAGEATRRAGLEGFRSLFEPGNIVELALASGPPAV